MFRCLLGYLLRPWLCAKMRRQEAAAEAAYAAMYDARPHAVKDLYDDARAHFSRAIDLAQRADLVADAAHLTARRDEVTQVYARQFRGVGYD